MKVSREICEQCWDKIGGRISLEIYPDGWPCALLREYISPKCALPAECYYRFEHAVAVTVNIDKKDKT